MRMIGITLRSSCRNDMRQSEPIWTSRGPTKLPLHCGKCAYNIFACSNRDEYSKQILFSYINNLGSFQSVSEFVVQQMASLVETKTYLRGEILLLQG